MEEHPEKCAAHFDVVMTKVVSLILGLAAIPTFGKKAVKYVILSAFVHFQLCLTHTLIELKLKEPPNQRLLRDLLLPTLLTVKGF